MRHVGSKKQLFVRGIYSGSPEPPPTSSPLREGREAGTEAGREAEREAGERLEEGLRERLEERLGERLEWRLGEKLMGAGWRRG